MGYNNKKGKHMKLKLFTILIIVFLLYMPTHAQSSCHILCNCTNSQCQSCYATFQATSNLDMAIDGTCACPQGFYSSNNLCLFCPTNCKVCATNTTCIQCYTGYTKINGVCTNLKYAADATWIQYEADQDFKTSPSGQPSIFGYTLLPTTSDIHIGYQACPALGNDQFVLVQSLSNHNISLIKAYQGLPYHQWAHLSISYVVMDNWNNQSLLVELYMDQRIANKTYDSSRRNTNLCGNNTYDGVDQIHAFVSHQASTLALNITLPPFTKIGIKQIKIDVGTCPRNCLQCQSPTNCLTCKNYYKNVNGICQCNTTLSHVVNYGCLPNCDPGYVFVQGVQRCILCSIYLRDCHACDNINACKQCAPNTFLMNGTCVTQCEVGYFPMKLPDADSTVDHCHHCAQNCTGCFDGTTCLSCKTNFYLYQGQCLQNCPSGASVNGSNCHDTTSTCPVGCSSCSSSTCSTCTNGYWLYQSSCLQQCPPLMYRAQNRTCQTCSSNCSKCIDSQTCSACLYGYSLRNSTCQYYTTSCIKLRYYFDSRVSNCIACPIGCLTCFRSLCYTCDTDYNLDNGRCTQFCSAQKYGVNDTISMNNICYWKNPFCQNQDNDEMGLCDQCRSMDYILALGSDQKCKTYCQATKTFSAHSLVFTQNSRFCSMNCPSNCQICISSLTCLKCSTNYILSGSNPGTCVSSCEAGFVSDSIQCVSCPYQCTTCDISGICSAWSETPTNISCPNNCAKCIGSTCVACSNNHYLDSAGECMNSCVSGTFPDTVSLQCRKCAPQCQTCSTFGKCSKCVNGYYLSEDACIRQCPIGKYPNAQNKTCDRCASNCRTCFGPKEHQCLSCYLGSKKDHTQCVAACPVHRYQDIYGSCDWCHEACKYCYGPAQFQCLQCDNSNYIYKSQCYPQCPAATYMAIPWIRECKQCSWGCATCTSPTSCQLCFGGFYLSGGQCLDVCPAGTYYNWQTYSCVPCTFANCTACIQSSCYQCQQSYSLYNGRCVYDCPAGTFKLDYNYGMQCFKCPSQCIACSSQYQCTSCQTGLILKEGQCTKNCDSGKYYDSASNSCRGCASGCVSCTTWGCSQCSYGYYRYNGACVLACPDGTYPISAAECAVCPFSCSACATYYQCSQCKAGYTLTNGVCTKNQTCSQNCQQCVDTMNCLICNQNYYRFTNSSGTFCANTCPAGTYAYADRECAKCLPECLKCGNGGSCTQCQGGLILFMGQCLTDCFPGFYAYTPSNSSAKNCTACSTTCQTCLNSTYCTSCSSPTARPQNGVCVEKKQCLLSAFYSQAVGYCLPCVQNCKICRSPTICDECLPSYIITVDGKCRSTCPSGTYAATNSAGMRQCVPCAFPCSICSGTDQCSQCLPGYPLNSSSLRCQPNCDRQVGYYNNLVTNKCEQCDSKCLECLGTATSCTECTQGYYLMNTQCVIQCPQGTFPSSSSRVCLPCSSYCQNCQSQNSCQHCQTYYVLLQGKCWPVCPSSYYAINGQCQPCTSPCRQCTGGSIYDCSTCQQGYFLFNNRCITNCPQGYYKNVQTQSCRKCPSSCKSCLTYESCIQCNSGYAYNSVTKQCNTVPNCPSTLPDCKTCTNTTGTVQCSACFAGYYLYQGQCVTNCNATYFQSAITGNCENCQPHCIQCSSATSCNACESDYYLFNGDCYNTCPNGTYPYTETIMNNGSNQTEQYCRVDPCVHYLNPNQCAVCVYPYLKDQLKCVEVCPSGTYGSELECKQCPPGCQSCVAYGKCTACDDGYHLYNMQCMQQCPTGTYSYTRDPEDVNSTTLPATGQCVRCRHNCLACRNETQCSKCSLGYFLNSNGQCVLVCDAPYYANIDTGVCHMCSNNCTKCTTPAQCQQCKSGSYLIGGQCVIECPAGTYPSSGVCVPCKQYCKVCNITSNCTQCQQGYLLNRVTNQCVRQCPSGTYLTQMKQCAPCSSNCLACKDPNRCLSCPSPKVLFNGQCVSQCPSGFLMMSAAGSCVECDPFCRECSLLRDNCTSCQSGFSLVNGYCRNTCPSHTFLNSSNQCQSCNSQNRNPRCSQCYGVALDQCIQCYSPYYLYDNTCVQNCPAGYYSTAATRECLPCDTRCLSCDTTATNCKSCPWGYYLMNGQCLSRCPAGYYADTNYTSQTCLPCVPPCLECTKLEICTKCISGYNYYLSPTGLCVNNCSLLTNSTNTTASALSYYGNPSTHKCEPCPYHCVTCTNSTTCTQCIAPYFAYQNTCVTQCPSSTYPSTVANKCQPCTAPLCLACTSNTQCTKCQPGAAYLLNGQCVTVCPTGYVVLDGKCVINNQNITVCTQYVLTINSTAKCVQYCPIGYYASTVNTPHTCEPCSAACLSCSSSTQCQICEQPYILNNAQCVTSCPQGYILLNSMCTACTSNCQTCQASPSQCKTCPSNYYLFNAQCVSSCPDSYYPTTSPNMCNKCAQQCAECTTAATQCTVCRNSRYSPPSCTDNSCPVKQYKIQATGQCYPCADVCQACSGGSIYDCITCVSPLLLINGQCRSECPSGYALNTPNNTCMPCPHGCRLCSIDTSLLAQCTQCFQPLILDEGQCLYDCSSLSTSVQSYTSDGSQCVPCSPHCLDCHLLDSDTGSTTCSVCQYGYILYLGQCLNTCPSQYYLLQRNCYKCPQNCLNCTSTPNSCTQCTNNTYLLNGNCVTSCPTGTYKNTATFKCQACTDIYCTNCSSSTSQCAQCQYPYVVEGGACKGCASGYVYNSNSRSCVPCDSACLTCSTMSSNCTSCPSGKVLVTGTCMDSCPTGYWQYSNTDMGIECKQCPSNCITCQPSASNPSSLQCYSCATGYYHNTVTHECVPQCPSDTYMSNNVDCQPCPTPCATCTSSTTCNTCKPGYYKLNNECVQECPSNYATIGSNHTCQACSSGCMVCVSSTNCTICRSDYYLASNRSCEQIEPCQNGYYADANGECQECASNCLQCTSLSNCTQCNSSTYLSNGQCRASCLDNQYGITVASNGITSKICIDCISPCDRCISNTSCTHCLPEYYLTADKRCVDECGSGYYEYNTTTTNASTNTTSTNGACVPCADTNCKQCNSNGCEQCNTMYYLYGYIAYNASNGTCVRDCPTGYYKDNSALPLQCKQCTISRCAKCNATTCTQCLPEYYLHNNTCVSECPSTMLAMEVNGVRVCENCTHNCIQCKSQRWCNKCDTGYYLYIMSVTTNTTTNATIDMDSTCVQECPDTYFNYNDMLSTNNDTCNKCEQYCKKCTNQTQCTQCISDTLYFLQNHDCIPDKCRNCTLCTNEQCSQCTTGFFLFTSDRRCFEKCPDGYYGNNETRTCDKCMDNCMLCPNLTYCDACVEGYNFTGVICMDQAYLQYGSLSNMSGFTSQLTKITSSIYIATSVGPIIFGEMTTTYFNIQFTQFIMFHGAASGGNRQVENFTNSLHVMTLSVPPSDQNTNNTNDVKRRMLASDLSDPLTFLQTNAGIFAMMGGFLAVYIGILLFEKYMQDSCLSCPNLKFYVTEICLYMKQRFKWIYFDFVAWISYLPFLFFALMQLKRFSFQTGLQGFSCILSMIIVVVYPLYPFFILYLLRKNYNDLVQQNNNIVQMSLSPFVYKVKRPEHQIPEEGQPWKNYITAANFRLAYEPFKYIRKIIFIFIVALCPVPVTSLILLIVLNLVFIGYMGGFMPRVMPYIVFDFIIEGVLLVFEIIMLAYLATSGSKISGISIGAHAFGFITANLSIIVAIILNLIAYYKIFMCIYDLYQHLKKQKQEKEKGKMSNEELDNQQIHSNYDDLPLKDQDLQKNLTSNKKVDDDSMTDQGPSGHFSSLMMRDKQLYGDMGADSQKLKQSGGLPQLKVSQAKKIRKQKKQQQQLHIDQDTTQNFFNDKQLQKKQEKIGDDQMTEYNHDSKIMSSILMKNKQIYGDQQSDLKKSIKQQLPNMKSSLKKSASNNLEKSEKVAQNNKLRRVTQSDEDSMIQSHLSGEQLLLKDGKLKDHNSNKYKRTSVGDHNQVIVAEGVPVEISKNKYKRNTKQLPRIDSMGLNAEEEGEINEPNYKNRDIKNKVQQAETFPNKISNKVSNQMYQQFQEKKQKIINVPTLDKQKARMSSKSDEYGDMMIQQFSETGNKKQSKNNIEDKQPTNKSVQQVNLYERKNKQKTKKSPRQKQQEQNTIKEGQFKNVSKKQKKQKQQSQIAQAQFKNVSSKGRSNEMAPDNFDDFIEESNDKIKELSTKQRQKAKNINTKNEKQQQQIAQGITKQRSKKHKGKKQVAQQQDETIEGGHLVDRPKNKYRRNNPAQTKPQMELDPQDVRYKQVVKTKLNKQGGRGIEKQQKDDQVVQKRNRKKRPEDQVEGQMADDYNRKQKGGQGQKQQKKRGLLGLKEEQQQGNYDQIRRKNKNNMFSPDKATASVMLGSLDAGDFQGSDYGDRPQSKIQRPGSRGKGNLGINDNSSVHSSDDEDVRRQRVQAKQRMRKMQGNLSIQDKSDYSDNDSVSSRPEKKERSSRRKRQKSGILKMTKKDDGQEDGVDKMQL